MNKKRDLKNEEEEYFCLNNAAVGVVEETA